MLWIRLLKRFADDSAGFTLLEVMVATSILTLGVGLIGTSVFQVLSASRFWQDDVAATKELRHAVSWVAGDAMNTKIANLIDSAPAESNVVLTTFAGDEITYTLSGDNLVRTFDDGVTVANTTVAREVVSSGFSLSGDVLTFSLEVTADHGGTKTNTLNTHLR